MSHKTVILTLTDHQLKYLNDAMQDRQKMNIDAIASNLFSEDMSLLFKECDAIQVFLDSVQSTLYGASNA